MSLLYRGVCKTVDQLNNGALRPKGVCHEISIKRDGQIQNRDGEFNRFPSENNTVRAHQLNSGMYNGCFISFTKSEDTARRFATRNPNNQNEDGFVYVVDDALFSKYGVVAQEVKDPKYPNEMEVTIRAEDNGDLPMGIVVEKRPVSSTKV